MESRCRLCGAPCSDAQVHCSRACARVAGEAAQDGVEGRLRRAFQRRKRPPVAPPDPDAEPMFFEVEGFWTGGCAAAVEEILKSVGGATDAHVIGETGRGRAYYDPEKTSEEDLLAILRRYGFRAGTVRDAWARAGGFSRSWEISLAVRLGVSATLSLAVAVLSFMLRSEMLRPGADTPTLRALMFFFTLPVLLYGGLPILANALWSVARRRVTADLLTGAAALGTFALSVEGLLENTALFFDASCAVVVGTLFARLCEYRARRRLARAGERLAGLVSGGAVRLRRGEEIPCSAPELR
ncbi:MAG: cation-translocating P-type ATPase, partial [Candidatus Brocadiae bacterium]|nr:cation-translocating P-type ATPase [Candidatus Brocadiia bacterium]